MGENILHKADRITAKDRNERYGHPRDNFKVIADYLTIYFRQQGWLTEKQSVEPIHVAPIMRLVKEARRGNEIQCGDREYLDTIGDIAGYARTEQLVLGGE